MRSLIALTVFGSLNASNACVGDGGGGVGDAGVVCPFPGGGHPHAGKNK